MDRFLRDPANPGSDTDVDVEARNRIDTQTLQQSEKATISAAENKQAHLF
jgi:hypothetical protein